MGTGTHVPGRATADNPVFTQRRRVEEQGRGRYRARVSFTMAGDWVVRLQGTRADGRRIDVQEDVRRVRPVE